MKVTQRAQWTQRAVSAALFLTLTSMPAWSAAIAVPDGDFTQAGGAGNVGGGLLTTDGSGTIGSGPWTGTYDAVLGLLVPPTLTIQTTGGEPSGGRGLISGLLQGVSILGPVVDNGGYFSQTLGATPFLANTTYTLTANVDPGLLLAAGVLTLDNAGVGIGLTNGGSDLANTQNPLDLLSLTLLGGTDYSLVLRYTTGSVAPSGNLGIKLYDLPSGVLQANLLGNVAFSNVTLDASPASTTPEPATFTMLFAGLFCMILGQRKLNWKFLRRKAE
jgi:hypothetical protein